METYKLDTEEGVQFGFEIENVYISTFKMAKLLSAVDGITNIQRRKLFRKYDDDSYRLMFDFKDETYLIVEPFGDSSRYWIYPKNSDHFSTKITVIEKIFRQYKPPILIKLIGDIISLKPIFFVVRKIWARINPKKS
jgi:hypothetical protein